MAKSILAKSQNNDQKRFFSLDKEKKTTIPFGLMFKESFFNNNDGLRKGVATSTHGASPTNTPRGTDSLMDVDVDF